MSHIRRRGDKWYVQWKELQVIRQPDGSDKRVWKTRGRSLPTKAAARDFAREVETTQAMGKAWKDAREDAVATIRNVALAYVRAAVDAGVPYDTQRFRSSMIGAFLDFLKAREDDDPGAELPVTELSLTLLEKYADSLPSQGRKAQTRYRKVMAAEQLWAWSYDRLERFPGVPVPKRYTGGSADADKLQAPPPVVASAAPTWADLDAMIGQLNLEWHRQVATIMRFTGLRVSQACGLKWSDVDLERRVLRVRAQTRGSKRSRSRVVPIHPWLVGEMSGWGEREGLLFPRRYRRSDGTQHPGPYRGDALGQPFRRAWVKAGVSPEKWDVDEERGKGSPTHAIRRCIRTELIRAGVEEALVLYLVGQSQGMTAAAYVPETSPEQSPYWPRLVQAVTLIPAPC
jgi:integrase